jgi:hypothetical protein
MVFEGACEGSIPIPNPSRTSVCRGHTTRLVRVRGLTLPNHSLRPDVVVAEDHAAGVRSRRDWAGRVVRPAITITTHVHVSPAPWPTHLLSVKDKEKDSKGIVISSSQQPHSRAHECVLLDQHAVNLDWPLHEALQRHHLERMRGSIDPCVPTDDGALAPRFRFLYLFLDKDRRDVGKSQSKRPAEVAETKRLTEDFVRPRSAAPFVKWLPIICAPLPPKRSIVHTKMPS